jgi:hypothetical protein
MVKVIAMTYVVPLLQILNLYPRNKYRKYPVLGDSHTYVHCKNRQNVVWRIYTVQKILAKNDFYIYSFMFFCNLGTR